MSLETQVGELVAKSGTLVNRITTQADAWDAKVNAAVAGVDFSRFPVLKGYDVGGSHIRYAGDLNGIDYNSTWNVASDNLNSPISSWSWGFVTTYVHNQNTSWRTQVWYGMTVDARYMRRLHNSTWTAWTAI